MLSLENITYYLKDFDSKNMITRKSFWFFQMVIGTLLSSKDAFLRIEWHWTDFVSSSKRKWCLICFHFLLKFLYALSLHGDGKHLLRDDVSDSVAKMEAAEKALEEKQKVIVAFSPWIMLIMTCFMNHLEYGIWWSFGNQEQIIKFIIICILVFIFCI